MHDSALKRALGYRRFGEAPRILLFDADYLVVEEVAEGIIDLGWPLHRLPTPRHGQGSSLFLRQLLEAAVTFRPDYVLTVNHLGFDEEGKLAALLADLGIAAASWFVDHPLPVLGGTAGRSSAMQLFCFEREPLPWLEAQGFEEPSYLPTASNGRYFRRGAPKAATVERLRHGLTFAGNSWFTKARLEPEAWAKKAAKPLLGHDRGIQQVLADRFAKRLRGKRLPPRGAYRVARVVLAEASLGRRQRLAEALAGDGLRVHGDPHWKTLVPDLDVAGVLDYHQELPALFAASDVNINVTAAQMPTAVNQRVFDVPAAGGFLLTDAQEDALELFVEDEEIVVYRDHEEAADKARYYGERADLRQAITARAEAMVERYHRYTHRLQMLDEVMRARFA